MFMLKELFVAHLKTNFWCREDMKGTLVSVKQLPFCNTPWAGEWKLISMSQSLSMSAICTKNAREKRLKTQQESPTTLFRQPQGNKMPMTAKSSRGIYCYHFSGGHPPKKAGGGRPLLGSQVKGPPQAQPIHTHTPHTSSLVCPLAVLWYFLKQERQEKKPHRH